MKKLGRVMGSFHKELVEKQRQEALKTAAEYDAEIIEEVWVPGSVEKPLAIKRLLQKEKIDAVIVIGIIEKGSTKHGFTMGQSLMHFVMQLQLEFMKPIGLGVLGPGISPDQIEPRLLSYAKKAVLAAVQMIEE